MVDEFVLHNPLDMHVHFRQGWMSGMCVRHTARDFAGALVMPNITPPVQTLEQLLAYRREIERAAWAAERRHFAPYMTFYFSTGFTREFLESAKPHVTAVKFYPKGLTTNSDHGCEPNDPGVEKVLGILQELDIPLCVHPERPGYHEDREILFASTAARWARRHPKLKIVLEHVSDARTIPLLYDFENVYATVTPHHLYLTGDDFVGPPLRPHNFCAPVPKQPSDREALRLLVLDAQDSVFRKVMLGTDSAPHPVSAKESACGCAGIFNAPVALPLLAQFFLERYHGRPARLQAFVSDNARAFYRVDPPPHDVRLVRKPFRVPERYGDVVPLFAGEALEWSVGRPSAPGS